MVNAKAPRGNHSRHARASIGQKVTRATGDRCARHGVNVRPITLPALVARALHCLDGGYFTLYRNGETSNTTKTLYASAPSKIKFRRSHSLH